MDELVGDAPEHAEHRARPYLGVLFECCGAYQRFYRRPQDLSYFIRCPRCLRLTRIAVRRDGSSARIFRAR